MAGGGGSNVANTGPWEGARPYISNLYGSANSLFNLGGPQYFDRQAYLNPLPSQLAPYNYGFGFLGDVFGQDFGSAQPWQPAFGGGGAPQTWAGGNTGYQVGTEGYQPAPPQTLEQQVALGYVPAGTAGGVSGWNSQNYEWQQIIGPDGTPTYVPVWAGDPAGSPAATVPAGTATSQGQIPYVDTGTTGTVPGASGYIGTDGAATNGGMGTTGAGAIPDPFNLMPPEYVDQQVLPIAPVAPPVAPVVPPVAPVVPPVAPVVPPVAPPVPPIAPPPAPPQEEEEEESPPRGGGRPGGAPPRGGRKKPAAPRGVPMVMGGNPNARALQDSPLTPAVRRLPQRRGRG